MLVLTRKNREAVIVAGGAGGLEKILKVTVLEITAGKVRLGFEADAAIPVHRFEIWERMCASGEFGRGGASPEAPNSESA